MTRGKLISRLREILIEAERINIDSRIEEHQRQWEQAGVLLLKAYEAGVISGPPWDEMIRACPPSDRVSERDRAGLGYRLFLVTVQPVAFRDRDSGGNQVPGYLAQQCPDWVAEVRKLGFVEMAWRGIRRFMELMEGRGPLVRSAAEIARDLRSIGSRLEQLFLDTTTVGTWQNQVAAAGEDIVKLLCEADELGALDQDDVWYEVRSKVLSRRVTPAQRLHRAIELWLTKRCLGQFPSDWATRLRALAKRASVHRQRGHVYRCAAHVVADIISAESAPPKPTQVSVREDDCSVSVDGQTYGLSTPRAGKFIRLLLENRHQSVPAAKLNDTCETRADRIFKKLPQPIRALIQPPGRGRKGYRLD